MAEREEFGRNSISYLSRQSIFHDMGNCKAGDLEKLIRKHAHKV